MRAAQSVVDAGCAKAVHMGALCAHGGFVDGCRGRERKDRRSRERGGGQEGKHVEFTWSFAAHSTLCEARRCSVPGQQGQIYAHLDRTLTPPFLLTIFAMY